MSYRHGIYGSEVPTSLIPMTNTDACLPVVFGTAPIHLASFPAEANTPVLCYDYAEAVAAFGYSDDWDKYTLCEFMKSHFALFNMAPVVFINVFDQAQHKENVASETVTLTDGTGAIDNIVYLPSLVVKADNEVLTKNIDYTASYSQEGKVIINAVPGGAIENAESITVAYDKLKPEEVTADDIIGGIDISTGKTEGLELINDIFPKFGLIPGQIIAPKWSTNPEVAAVLKAKTTVNGIFKAMALNDIPTETIKKYTAASEWKNSNNYNDNRQILCWPKVRLSDKQYHLSTQLAGVICKLASENGDVPYKSPSNKSLQANGACLADGTEITLGPEKANYLNGQGILTALNFIGGWKTWGNRTCCYPSNTDPKDSFIPVRVMFNWVNNTLITTFWSKIDDPTNKRLIETIVDSANVWLNGLTSRQFLLGGRVEFRADENPTTDLIDGIIKFHVYLTPPTPAREIEFIQEFDINYYSTLFS